MVALCVNLITCSRGLMFLAELTDRLFAAGSRCLVGDIRPVKARVRTARSGHFPALDTPGEGASEGLARPGGVAAGAVSPAKEGGGRNRFPGCRGAVADRRAAFGGAGGSPPGRGLSGSGCLPAAGVRLISAAVERWRRRPCARYTRPACPRRGGACPGDRMLVLASLGLSSRRRGNSVSGFRCHSRKGLSPRVRGQQGDPWWGPCVMGCISAIAGVGGLFIKQGVSPRPAGGWSRPTRST